MAGLLRQFIRFFGVGCVSAIGHFGLLIFLVQAGGVDAVAASTAGAVLGAVINYSLNYRFTFRSTKQHRESATKFAILVVIGWLLNALLMWIGVNKLGIDYRISQVLTTGLLMVWNFFANRFWTFRVADGK
jgi:putative flippase GtrA